MLLRGGVGGDGFDGAPVAVAGKKWGDGARPPRGDGCAGGRGKEEKRWRCTRLLVARGKAALVAEVGGRVLVGCRGGVVLRWGSDDEAEEEHTTIGWR